MNITQLITKGNNQATCFQAITPDNFAYPYNALYAIILLLIALFIIITNCLLLFGFIKITKKYKSSQILTVALSTFDLCTAIIAIPIQFYVVLIPYHPSCTLSSFQMLAAILTPWISGFIICVITLLRLITMLTKKFRVLLENRSTIILILSVTLLGILFSAWCFVGFFLKKPLLLTIYYSMTGVFVLILLFLVILVNIKIVGFLSRNRHNTSVTRTEYQYKVTRSIFIMSITSVISYVPSSVGWIVASYYYSNNLNDIDIPHTFMPWLQLFIYLNGGMSPLIYMCSTGIIKRIKNEVSKSVRARCSNGHSQIESNSDNDNSRVGKIKVKSGIDDNTSQINDNSNNNNSNISKTGMSNL